MAYLSVSTIEKVDPALRTNSEKLSPVYRYLTNHSISPKFRAICNCLATPTTRSVQPMTQPSKEGLIALFSQRTDIPLRDN